MKNSKVVARYAIMFLCFSAVMFLLQWILQLQDVLVLSYKIHFLLFFVTFISVATVLGIFSFNKKNIIGFVFLGFVVFKLFAIGYIAMFEEDFKNNLIPYFLIYWLYLAIEVIVVVGLVRKQDESHIKI